MSRVLVRSLVGRLSGNRGAEGLSPADQICDEANADLQAMCEY